MIGNSDLFLHHHISMCQYMEMENGVSPICEAKPAADGHQTLRLKAEHIAKLYRGLSDRSRLMILETLRTGPMTVTQIVQATGLGQPNVSNHLGCLYDCGLVKRDQEGRYVRYRLSDSRVELLLRASAELLADAAQGVVVCTEIDCE